MNNINNDLISRQQAVDAVKKNTFRLKFVEEQNYESSLAWSAKAVYSELMEEALLDLPSIQPTSGDCISRQAAIDKFIDALEEIFSDIREEHVDDSVCGLCEYDGAYIGQSGDWCNECPGFDRDDCFKLSDKTRKKWTDEIIKAFPSIQPERKTGRWIPSDSELEIKCNKCGKDFSEYVDSPDYIYLVERPKFCPNCGTDMRGERDE